MLLSLLYIFRVDQKPNPQDLRPLPKSNGLLLVKVKHPTVRKKSSKFVEN